MRYNKAKAGQAIAAKFFEKKLVEESPGSRTSKEVGWQTFCQPGRVTVNDSRLVHFKWTG